VGGRTAQKRRTYLAVLAAAAELVRQGRSPTVAEAAALAGVSRATAYRHFPTQEYLLAGAALEPAALPIDAALDAAPPDDPEARVDAVAAALHAAVLANESAFRTVLRLSLGGAPETPLGDPLAGFGPPAPAAGAAAPAAPDPEGAPAGPQPQRGGRRLRWLEAALAPARPRLSARRAQRLAAALALVMGPEAFVVLRDVCHLKPDEAERVSRWAAGALVRAGLREADGA
jgi:AcrR family transcriptional regulator